MAKSKYHNLSFQEFEIYAYKTKNLNHWQKQYRTRAAYGVWVKAGTVIARSPWEASRLARFCPDQRVPVRFHNYKLRAQPSFERATA